MDYSTKSMPSWCASCGDFGILTGVKKALLELEIPPHKVAVIAGIGCGSLMPYWLKTYGACTLHGRAIPFATGVRLSSHDNKVLVSMGDGDGLGIGMGHFIHFFRRNLDMTVICHNNGVYGLTKGQTAPTAKKGTKTSSTPFGSIEEYVNGAALALQMGATFVARAYTSKLPQLVNILKRAISHKGSAFIDVLQPCVTYNKKETYDFYNERVTEVEAPCKTRAEALAMVNTPQEKIPTGIFYEETRDTYEEHLPQFEKGSLQSQDIENIDVSGFLEKRK